MLSESPIDFIRESYPDVFSDYENANSEVREAMSGHFGKPVAIPPGLNTPCDISENDWVRHVEALGVLRRTRQSIKAERYPWTGQLIHEGQLTSEAKYVLGLAAADGTFSENALIIGLKASDQAILHRISDWCSDGKRPVKTRPTKQIDGKIYHSSILNLCGQHMLLLFRDLLGVWTTSKTLTLRPKHFLLRDADFLRGLIDGDGSFLLKETGVRTSHQIKIVTAAYRGLLVPLKQILYQVWGIKSVDSDCGKSLIAKELAITGDGDARKLAQILYEPSTDASEMLCLERKAITAEIMLARPSKRLRPVRLTKEDISSAFLTYIDAAKFIFDRSKKQGSYSKIIKQYRQDLSRCFQERRDQNNYSVNGWYVSVPIEAEVAEMLEIDIALLRQHAPYIAEDISKRSRKKSRLSMREFSPFLARRRDQPKTEALLMSNKEAVDHELFKDVNNPQQFVSNLSKELPANKSREWVSRRRESVNGHLEITRPTITEVEKALTDRSDIYANFSTIRDKLKKRGYAD